MRLSYPRLPIALASLAPKNLIVATLAVTAIFLSPYLGSTSQAQTSSNNWTQWRGPNRDGTLNNAQPWPQQLDSDSLQPLWRVELQPSYSSPIVTDDFVFVTETIDRQFESVKALDRKTGNEVWKVQWAGSIEVPFFAKANGSWIRSTPIYEDGRLYVAGIRDVLVCLDAKTGNEIWRVDFVEQTDSPVPTFGCVCSPLIHGDSLFVQAGGGLAKLDKLTGDIEWIALKDGGGMQGSAFSSPVVATILGVEQLVVQTRSTLCGVTLSNGDVLWSKKIPAFQGMNILTPTVIENEIFTSSYGGKSLMLQLSRSDDQWNVEEKWTNRKEGYMSSPIVIDGHIYLHLRNQRFTCLDWETGEDSWTSETFGQYWSLVVNNNQVLALDQTGMLRTFQASPDAFKIAGEARVADQETWAHLGVVGDELFIRELNAMTVLRWQPPSP